MTIGVVDLIHDRNAVMLEAGESRLRERIAKIRAQTLQIEARIAKLRAKTPKHKLDADGFIDAAEFVRTMWRRVLSEPPDVDANGKPNRAFLRRREAHFRKFPLHDAHIREYVSATTPTQRTIWSCPRCRREIRFLDRPRDADGKLKKHCGCQTGKRGGRQRVVDPAHRVLHDRISRSLWCAMRGMKSGRKWQAILGYTVPELQAHLERMLPRGYTIKRCIAERWHIDHIVAKSDFDCSTDEGIRAAWALSNLRLIPGPDNLKKSSKRVFLL